MGCFGAWWWLEQYSLGRRGGGREAQLTRKDELENEAPSTSSSFLPSLLFTFLHHFPPLPLLDVLKLLHPRVDVIEGKRKERERGQGSFKSKLTLPSFTSTLQPSLVSQITMLTSLLSFLSSGTTQRCRNLPDVLHPCVRSSAPSSFPRLRSAHARLRELSSSS